MAQYFVRAKLAAAEEEDPLAPSLDILYTDEWTDPTTGAVPGTEITLEFGVLDPVTDTGGPNNLQTDAPVLIGSCLTEWNSLCRTVIDYPDHIQPIFEVARVRNINGVDEDVRCLNCHAPVDVDGNAQVPAPDKDNLQLDFTNVISPLDDDMVLLRGYDEFFAADDPLFTLDPVTGTLVPQLEQLVVNGVPQFEMQQQVDVNGSPLFEANDANGALVCVTLADAEADPNLTLLMDGAGANIACLELVFETDADGNLVLDALGNPIPIPVLVAVTQNRYLSAQAANAARNDRFWNVFQPGAPHDNYLTPAELKLFSEWLDVGGQYYNEIFKALED